MSPPTGAGFQWSRLLFSPSRLAGLSGVYSDFHFIGVFVENAEIIHGWFRFSSGNSRVFILKVEIKCQLRFCQSACTQGRPRLSWKPH